MYSRKSFILAAFFTLLCGFFLLTTDSIAIGPPLSDCCIENGTAGCSDQQCEDSVCALDNFCCAVIWDSICVAQAEVVCSDLCMNEPPPTPEGCCVGLREFPETCEILTEQECNDEGGEYLGDDTDCDLFRQCSPPSLTPLDATNEIPSEHTVTATLIHDGAPVEEQLVQFTILSGPNEGETSDPNSGECTPNDDCTTDANGEVSWTYTSRDLGTDTIVAAFLDESIEVQSNLAEKTWIIVRNIPVLSGWGFVIIAGLLGIVAVIVLKRKKTLFRA